MKKDKLGPTDYIKPLIINGLKGRVLYLPAYKKTAKRQILLVYGSHSSLERMFGICEDLAQYGSVTVPDLPGFGGMDSFYKIGEKPTLDNLADYLATFIKLRFKKSSLTVGGMSFGFVIVTRMLQKYPELVDQIEILINFVGFSSWRDFKIKRKTYLIFRWGSSICSNYMMSVIAKYVVLRGPFIRATYQLIASRNFKLRDADMAERRRRINFEVGLWQSNDIRTYMDTTVTMMTVDLTGQKIALNVLYVSVNGDQFFNHQKVKANLNKIYRHVEVYKAKMSSHAPTVISNAKQAKGLIPSEIRKKLAKKPTMRGVIL